MKAMDLLIIKHGALGDVVRTSYFLPGLHRKYGPDTRIFWLTSNAAVDLLRYHPQIYRLTTDPSELAPREFDCILSLDDERQAAATATQLKHKQLVGACLSSNALTYTPDSATWFDMGLISKYGKQEADRLKKANTRSHAEIFSKILGITIDEGRFFNSPLVEQSWERRLESRCFRIGINPFAGKRWPAKAVRMGELHKLIPSLLDFKGVQRPVKIYLFGEGDDRKQLEELSSKFAGRVEALDTSASVLDFAAAIKSLDYLITTDSLALHLAVAQGVRNLSFYAPTSAAEIDTFGTGVKLRSIAPDYCSYRKDADNSTITAERLLAAAQVHYPNQTGNGTNG